MCVFLHLNEEMKVIITAWNDYFFNPTVSFRDSMTDSCIAAPRLSNGSQESWSAVYPFQRKR